MYEKNEPFQFIHCWKMICKEPKWCDRQLKLKNQASGKGDAGTQLKIQFMFNQRQGILLIAAQGQKAEIV
jgi:hypothetical protein